MLPRRNACLAMLVLGAVVAACAQSGEAGGSADPVNDDSGSAPLPANDGGARGGPDSSTAPDGATGSPDAAAPTAKIQLASLPPVQGNCYVGTTGAELFVLQSGDSGTISRLPIAGGTVVPLVTGLVWPRGLFVDGGDVYYSARVGSTTSVYRVAAAGGAPQEIGSGYAAVYSVAADSGYIYWTEGGAGGGMWRTVRAAGSTPTKIAAGTREAFNLKVTNSQLVFTDIAKGTGDGVYTVPLAGGTPALLAKGQLTTGVEVTATDAFYSQFGTFSASYQDGKVFRVSLAGGAPSLIADQQGYVSSNLVADGTSLYWGAGSTDPDAADGAVLRASTKGGPTTVLATKTRADWLLVHGNDVYWCGLEGGVYRAAK